MESKKIKQMNEYNKAETQREQTSGYHWRDGKGEGQVRGKSVRDINYYV